MSAITEKLRADLCAAINEGRDVDAHAILPRWRRAVAEDKAAALAEAENWDLLCGPCPNECDGRLRVDGIGVDCPLSENCERRGEPA